MIRILKIILSSFITLFGLNVNRPVNDLHKKPTREDHIKTVECWIARHFTALCFIIIVLMFIAFIFVCFAFVGVSAVESGGMRNFANGGYV